MTFQPGDVVALKSGGPLLTVSAVSDENVQCIWIGEEGDFFRESVPAAVLTAAGIGDGEETDAHDTEDADDEDDQESDEVRKIA